MIAIIGGGNVATHLYNALKDKSEVCLVNSRTLENLPDKAEVFLISVSDDAIGDVAEKIKDKEGIIAHTSGSVALPVIPGKETGIFYPLQTFSKNLNIDYSDIPVFIEGSSISVINKLKAIASLFTGQTHEVNSEKRKELHLASVFACNFTNALIGIAYDLLRRADFKPELIKPLLNQTLQKLEKLSPQQAQTGPAVREDRRIIESHLSMLEDNPEYKEIYSLITNLIINRKKKI